MYKMHFDRDWVIVHLLDKDRNPILDPASEEDDGFFIFPLTIAAEAIQHFADTGCSRACGCTPFVSDYNEELEDEEIEQGEAAAA
jgi:hypothetical protein